ncbi:hypothetical protein ACLMJK_001702 [Lecanora helva]
MTNHHQSDAVDLSSDNLEEVTTAAKARTNPDSMTMNDRDGDWVSVSGDPVDSINANHSDQDHPRADDDSEEITIGIPVADLSDTRSREEGISRLEKEIVDLRSESEVVRTLVHDKFDHEVHDCLSREMNRLKFEIGTMKADLNTVRSSVRITHDSFLHLNEELHRLNGEISGLWKDDSSPRLRSSALRLDNYATTPLPDCHQENSLAENASSQLDTLMEHAGRHDLEDQMEQARRAPRFSEGQDVGDPLGDFTETRGLVQGSLTDDDEEDDDDDILLQI